ncbi:DUF3231 family protein [Gorillibacterium sp. sgz5001074]|uniref:DUF3231 family protein n=1 Tax=Gorillibacterium sp. sgz5001074 TaxID=3446695 RepID=UPI003F66DFB4
MSEQPQLTSSVPIPVGFTAQDVNKDAPRLYDHGFDIMFIRLVKKISMALHVLNIAMSFREDIISLYKELTAFTQETYRICTKYLLDRGLIGRPPYTTMPQSVEFVKDTAYLGSLNPFSEKRTLNTIEVAHLYHAIESNTVGMQMILGFAQSAQLPETKKFFYQGAELAKSIIKELSETLLESDVTATLPSGGNATESTVPPFSDKLMMYCVSLFCSFSLGGNSLGTVFSLRNDLPAKMTIFMKDIFEYAHEAAKMMIRNGWLEEPPQMDRHKQLAEV